MALWVHVSASLYGAFNIYFVILKGTNIGYSKTELNWEEWYGVITELCVMKHLDQEYVELALTNCGLPGASPVTVPEYKSFFDTFKAKSKMMVE